MEQLIDILSKNIFLALAEELKRQNHKLTGALVESFESLIKDSADKLIIEFLMLNYGLSLNDGIKPSRVPYTIPTPGRRGGGKNSGRRGGSKYIQGLIHWAKLKFRLSEKKARGMAFAVARKHKLNGFPLTETGFINNVLEKEEAQIEQFVEDWLDLIFEDFFKSFLKDFK